MWHVCPTPKLHALSLLGTQACIYNADKTTLEIDPLYMDRPCPERVLPKDFLKSQWELDILSQDGFEAMQKIVSYILEKSTNSYDY